MSSERVFASALFMTIIALTAINYSLDCDITTHAKTIDGLLSKERISPKSIEEIIPIEPKVKPVLYTDVDFIESLTIPEAKSTFINIMLPAILVAKEELAFQRNQVQMMLNKEKLDRLDSTFLSNLFTRFKTDDLRELSKRMVTHPNSIILAQAAVESGWGKSRFFKEANNVFGVWSMNSYEDRIPAKFSRDGKTIYLKRYPDISASIKDYFYTIGKVNAYKAFRAERLKTNSVKDLLPYLDRYSELGDEYVQQLERMIRLNGFEQFDSYKLDPTFFNK